MSVDARVAKAVAHLDKYLSHEGSEILHMLLAREGLESAAHGDADSSSQEGDVTADAAAHVEDGGGVGHRESDEVAPPEAAHDEHKHASSSAGNGRAHAARKRRQHTLSHKEMSALKQRLRVSGAACIVNAVWTHFPRGVAC